MEDIFKILVALGVLIYSIVSAAKKTPKKTIYYDPPKKKEEFSVEEDEEEEDSFDREDTVMQESYDNDPYESDPYDNEQYNFGQYESLEAIPVNEYSSLGSDMASRSMGDMVVSDTDTGDEVVQNNKRPDIDLKKAIIYQTILERKYV